MTVAMSQVFDTAQAMLWAMVEAPTPPLAPVTAIRRPTGCVAPAV